MRDAALARHNSKKAFEDLQKDQSLATRTRSMDGVLVFVIGDYLRRAVPQSRESLPVAN